MAQTQRIDAQGHVVDEQSAAVAAKDASPCGQCGHRTNAHALHYSDGTRTVELELAAFQVCALCDCVVTLMTA